MPNSLFLALAAVLVALPRAQLSSDEIAEKLRNPTVRHLFQKVGPRSHAMRLPSEFMPSRSRERQLVTSNWTDIVRRLGRGAPPTTGKLRALCLIAGKQPHNNNKCLARPTPASPPGAPAQLSLATLAHPMFCMQTTSVQRYASKRPLACPCQWPRVFRARQHWRSDAVNCSATNCAGFGPNVASQRVL